jgi:MerR HTH family regulatory protein
VAERPRLHGSFLAGDVGELAGVSGNTIGQWARRGLIRSSQSDGEPRLYAVEDIAEATVVAELLGRGVRHLDVHRASERLAPRCGLWPLSDAPLGTIVEDGGRPRIVLLERESVYELVPRGWQLMAAPPPVDDVRVRLRHAP